MTSKTSTMRAQLPVRGKGNTKCNIHKDNDVLLLCQDCKDLICITCSLSTHKAHNGSFVELSKLRKEYQNIILDFVNETAKVNIPELNQKLTTSRTKITSCKPHYDKLRKNILDHSNQCKEELDLITAEYLSLCDKMEIRATDCIQTHITNMEERLEMLRNLSSEYKQTLQTGTAVLVYDSVSEIQELDTDIPPTPNTDLVEFTPGNNWKSHLKQAMGNIKTLTDHAGSATGYHSGRSPVVRPKLLTGQTPEVRYIPRQTVISQFSYPDDVTSICPTSDGHAWLCDFDTDSVKLINNKGHVQQTIQHTSNIRDISLDPTTGRLWFCCWNERIVWEISTSSMPVKKFDTEDYPYSMCVTMEGRVVVGTVSKEHGYKVVMYTADGRVLHTASVERSGAGGVQSVAQCGVTGNIAVVISKYIRGEVINRGNSRRHVTVYSSTLQLLFHYRGERIIQDRGKRVRESMLPHMFDPFTVVYDSRGNLVIANRTKNTIELISGAGKYIETLHTSNGKQGRVGIQKDDVVWAYLSLDTRVWGFKLLKYYSDWGQGGVGIQKDDVVWAYLSLDTRVWGFKLLKYSWEQTKLGI